MHANKKALLSHNGSFVGKPKNLTINTNNNNNTTSLSTNNNNTSNNTNNNNTTNTNNTTSSNYGNNTSNNNNNNNGGGGDSDLDALERQLDTIMETPNLVDDQISELPSYQKYRELIQHAKQSIKDDNNYMNNATASSPLNKLPTNRNKRDIISRYNQNPALAAANSINSAMHNNNNNNNNNNISSISGISNNNSNSNLLLSFQNDNSNNISSNNNNISISNIGNISGNNSNSNILLVQQQQQQHHQFNNNGINFEDLYYSLQQRYDLLNSDYMRQKELLKIRQETYIQREKRNKQLVQELRMKLQEALTTEHNSDKMNELRQLKQVIDDEVLRLKGESSQLLEQQENEYTRRMKDVERKFQKQLLKEQQKNFSGEREWHEKSRAWKKSLENAIDEAKHLDKTNSELAKENQRLKIQYSAQAEDRLLLAKQVAKSKRENTVLKEELTRVQQEYNHLHETVLVLTQTGTDQQQQQHQHIVVPLSAKNHQHVNNNNHVHHHNSSQLPVPNLNLLSSSLPLHNNQQRTSNNNNNNNNNRPSTTNSVHFTSSTSMNASNNNSNRNSLTPPINNTSNTNSNNIAGNIAASHAAQDVQNLKETIIKLRKLLEHERRNLKMVRNAHLSALAERTELEVFLKQCIEDVKQELSKHSMSRQISGAMTAHDRQRVIDILLSKERVLQLLYEKTSPSITASNGGTSFSSNSNNNQQQQQQQLHSSTANNNNNNNNQYSSIVSQGYSNHMDNNNNEQQEYDNNNNSSSNEPRSNNGKRGSLEYNFSLSSATGGENYLNFHHFKQSSAQ